MRDRNEFDLKAKEWDLNPMHLERSKAIAEMMLRRIPFSTTLTALEFGAGTGLLSLLLYDKAGSITMVDNSEEMTKVMRGKIESSGVKNLKVLCKDLEKEELTEKFGLIFSQIVLHHVVEPEKMLEKFSTMLEPGGYLAVADLYPEDGSFHGEGFTGHNGFDPTVLTGILEKLGCTLYSLEPVFTIRRELSDRQARDYPVFLLIVRKKG